MFAPVGAAIRRKQWLADRGTEPVMLRVCNRQTPLTCFAARQGAAVADFSASWQPRHGLLEFDFVGSALELAAAAQPREFATLLQDLEEVHTPPPRPARPRGTRPAHAAHPPPSAGFGGTAARAAQRGAVAEEAASPEGRPALARARARGGTELGAAVVRQAPAEEKAARMLAMCTTSGLAFSAKQEKPGVPPSVCRARHMRDCDRRTFMRVSGQPVRCGDWHCRLRRLSSRTQASSSRWVAVVPEGTQAYSNVLKAGVCSVARTESCGTVGWYGGVLAAKQVRGSAQYPRPPR